MHYSVIPPHLAVKSMRDSGYRNAAYAIAELMDNSIQAKATEVELLCAEKTLELKSNLVSRIDQVALLDNGSGMNSDVLRIALQFGNGTHTQATHQEGIGKFGMGLPSASISQARKVEVWTWKEGTSNSLYTYLDIDDILNKQMTEIPEPTIKEIPDVWLKAGKTFAQSGTLVVWSNIDRCQWKTARAIINHSELIIGRMYRRFINKGKVKIRLVGFDINTPLNPYINKEAKPNDPMYLMPNTSCPSPFDKEPMFEQWGGEDYEIKYDVNHKGKIHSIFLRFSVAKKEARQDIRNAGSLPYGQHAGKNMGVSIMRADRELELDQSWLNGYDPTERWWGVEIDFPPGLDEVFGVTNNKQFANNFSELGKTKVRELLKIENKSAHQYKDELIADDDPKAYLLDIALRINDTIKQLRTIIDAQTANKKISIPTRHDNNSQTPEKTATEITEDLKNKGHKGTSDKQEDQNSEEANRQEAQQYLEDQGVEEAAQVVSWLYENNLKYSFTVSDLDAHAFFSVRPKGGKIFITLNQNHPAYHKLIEVLEDPAEDESIDKLKVRLIRASEGLKLLLMAWARYEDQSQDGEDKQSVQNARQDWGKMARVFLAKED